MRVVRDIRELRVWSRNADKARSFADEMNAIAADSAQAAVQDADIVITATNAKEPVLEADWIRPGTHINAMGSNVATRRELPADIVCRADVIAVDSLEQARMEAGDLILANCWDRAVELQTVRPGYEPGRITVFKSIGLGVEDVAAGAYVYEQARRKNLGRNLYS
jgi:ornithine cyclodeaminase/alanine dehydrogenase-like protein (mu-crystallin family)